MKIRFLYFEGCPNSEPTLANLSAAISDSGLPVDMIVTEVTGPEQADAEGFLGSPSILVDGRDLESGDVPQGSSYSCRIYTIDGRRTGVVEKSYILERLLQIDALGRR